jgi:tetratricopeptide (TPR) repeat protein
MGRRLGILAALGGVAICTALAGEPEESREIWNDPRFRRQFLGTYGVLGELEPRISLEERDQLEKIIPLLSTDLGKAAEQLSAIVTPNSSATLDFTLANVNFQLDRLEEAVRWYRSALEKFPSFLRAHKNLGLTYTRLGDTANAIPAFTRMIELGGGDGLTYGLLGRALSAREDFLSAESAFRQAVLLQPDSLEWRLGLIRCLFRLQKYEEAASLCGELLGKHPDRSEFWQLQANAFLGLNQPLRAAQNFEVLDRLGKATPEILYSLGDIYVNESLPDLAARAYGEAIRADSGEDPGRALRSAEALAARGAPSQARRVLDHLEKAGEDRLDETARRRLLRLEARIALSEGEGNEAVEILEEIVALDPLDGEALMLLAQHHTRKGEPERAIFYYERAENLEGFEADARVRHAQVLVRLSRFQEALPLLKRAQELKPREELATYLEQVERAARAAR